MLPAAPGVIAKPATGVAGGELARCRREGALPAESVCFVIDGPGPAAPEADRRRAGRLQAACRRKLADFANKPISAARPNRSVKNSVAKCPSGRIPSRAVRRSTPRQRFTNRYFIRCIKGTPDAKDAPGYDVQRP